MNEAIGKKSGKSLDFLVKYGVYTIFVIMFIVFSFSNRNFLSISNIMMLLQQASPLCLGVIGMAFVMMDGGIDISAGSNMYISAVTGALLLEKLNADGVNVNAFWVYGITFIVAMLMGACVGVFNGFLIAKLKILPFIVTLITTSITRGLGMYISGARLIIINSMGFKLTDKSFLGINIVIFFAVAGIIIFHLIMKYTTYGCQLKAQGNNHEAALKLGINIVKNSWIAYIICGALCGLGGMLAIGSSGSVLITSCTGNEFVIIPAAVLGGISLFGGKGTVFPGCIIGILLTYTIENGLTMMAANPYVYTIVRGIIIFLAVMVDSMNYKGELR